jgi:hypothetical protein
MSLKSIVEALESVPEALRSFYAETDGKFVLQVDDVDQLPTVRGLKKSYDNVVIDKKTLKADIAKLKAETPELPEGFDLEVWNNAKAGLVDQAQIEAAKREVRQALEGEVVEWRGKYEGLQCDIRTANTTSALTSALTAIGVTDAGLLEGAKASLMSRVQYGDDNNASMDMGLGPQSIDEGVARWAKDAGKSFITKATGADTNGNDSGKTTVSTGNQTVADRVPGFADLPVS